MSTPEQNLYQSVKKGLNPRGIWLGRLEDINMVGLPDCIYTVENLSGAGFIEFKYQSEFPKREKTIIKLEHFTPQQRAWFQMHGPRIQRVFLLLRISTTFMLFPWTTVKNIGTLHRADLVQLASDEGGCWGSRINYDELVKMLRRDYAKKGRHI